MLLFRGVTKAVGEFSDLRVKLHENETKVLDQRNERERNGRPPRFWQRKRHQVVHVMPAAHPTVIDLTDRVIVLPAAQPLPQFPPGFAPPN